MQIQFVEKLKSGNNVEVMLPKKKKKKFYR